MLLPQCHGLLGVRVIDVGVYDVFDNLDGVFDVLGRWALDKDIYSLIN